MQTRNMLSRFSIAIALMALAATSVWQIRRAHAMPTAVEDQATFGMVGITHGQTMRLNVVNLTSPDPTKGEIPPPCRVVLSFRDGNGRPFTDANGQVISREVELQAGRSAFLDLNGDGFAGPSTNDAVAPTRLQLRPFVRVLTTPSEADKKGVLPDPCRATMEIFDNSTGRTSIFSAGFEPPPDPDRGQ